VIPSAALFASAIEDAEGFPITAMPISPSDLFELRAARGVGGGVSQHLPRNNTESGPDDAVSGQVLGNDPPEETR
jgi:carbon-monoxide dehydrogenase large subunit